MSAIEDLKSLSQIKRLIVQNPDLIKQALENATREIESLRAQLVEAEKAIRFAHAHCEAIVPGEEIVIRIFCDH